MPVPSQPHHILPRAFAEGGNYTLVPDSSLSSGRASFEKGFPVETQLPLREGGVAPNRTDFNGMFYLLSAMGFWQQSGGQWAYDVRLNYTTPCIVFYRNIMWWCLKENGPDSDNGLVEPGTNEEYWQEYLNFLAGGDAKKKLGSPVGTIIMYPSIIPPSGYFVCDGSPYSVTENPELYSILGSANLPDMRGLFVRGYDPQSTNDPGGDSREIMSLQQDAGRRVTGSSKNIQYLSSNETYGSFYFNGGGPNGALHSGPGSGTYSLALDSQREWGAEHTAPEFRPKNITLQYCIKHD